MFDVTIIGSGIVGSALALALAKSTRLKIAVIDVQSPIASTRVSAISPAVKTFLSSLNIWDRLQTVSPYTKMYVWDAASSGEILFDSQSLSLPHLGYIVQDSELRAALHAEFATANIEFFHPLKLHDLQRTSRGFQLISADKIFLSQLVVAADGANSWARQTQNISIKTWDYGHKAIVATVRCELPHQQTAWQRFLPNGPLAFLPLMDPHSASIVWSVTPTRAKELLALCDDDFCQQLGDAFAHRLGNILTATPRQAFSLQMRHAKNYVQENFALVGDAAHTIHPLAGLGVNMGVLDVKYLAEIIQEAIYKQRNFSSFATLRRYERKRKSDNTVLLMGVEGLKNLFASRVPWVQTVRSMGLNTTNSIHLFKNFFARCAI